MISLNEVKGFISERCEETKLLSQRRDGFTIVEVILAMGLFAIVVGGGVGAAVRAFSANRLGEEESQALFLANEGIEAARAIADRDYFNLVNGTYGLATGEGIWEFSGSSQALGKFTRQVVISNVFRDAQGKIVSSGGTLDLFTKRVESRVSWNFVPSRTEAIALKTYFTYWLESICEWGDTAELTQVGGLNLTGNINATDIEVAEEGEVGYVTGEGGGQTGVFFTLDLTNPLNPQTAGSLTGLSKVVDGVAVSGNYAYLATAISTQELMVVNVSNPASPAVVGSSGTPAGAALDVATINGFVYLGVTNNNGPEFFSYNVSNPANPAVLGTYEVGKDVSAISVAGSRAYLAVTTTGSGQSNLLVLDISNPANITEIGSYAAPGVPPGAKGEAVFYSGGVVHMVISGSASSPLYYLLDASDPANISMIGSLPAQGGMQAINDVETGSGFALLATDKAADAILIVDIRNPSNPTRKLGFALGGGANGLGAKINGCYAYVASTDNNQEIKVVAPE